MKALRLALIWFLTALPAFCAPSTTQPAPNGGIWPLGLTTVVTAGTPVVLNNRIAPGNPQCNQIWFKNPGSATIYIQATSAAWEATYSQTIFYLLPGETFFMNASATAHPVWTPSKIYVDASANGGTVLATCYQGGS